MRYLLVIILFATILIGCNEDPVPQGPTGTGKLGEPCNSDGSCDSGLFCNRSNVCEQIVQEDCTPNSTQACYTGSNNTKNVGACKEGLKTCNSDGKWGACENEVLPTDEICGDEVDNNCNGQKDEGCGCEEIGATKSCYSGETGTEGIGICKTGILRCGEDFTWSTSCEGEVKPIEEICGNRVDDNCNGFIDEDCGNCEPASYRDCYTGPENTNAIGVCKVGKEICNDLGEWSGNCVGEVLPGNSELCGDGVDNNCDGRIDEECPCTPGEARVCYSGAESNVGKGICRNGIQVCTQQGVWEQNCLGETLPGVETCDGIDNNCNGIIDEGVSNSCGECGVEPVEVCDGIDNNCDGRIDEGVMNRCGGCGAEPAEICNDGLDNNCDGEIDENCTVNCNGDPNCNQNWECIPLNNDGTPNTRACYSGPIETRSKGLCHDGTQVCVNGFWSGCKYESLPNVEVCDEQDNDCDGVVDDDCGFNNCSSFEVCNDGIDNNCDGEIDEGCSSTPECVSIGTEICGDGIDNNCNGSVDDGCGCTSGNTQSCYPGPANTKDVGECRSGSQTCIGGEDWSSCSNAVTPVVETCDGKDNDCDGVIDNGFFIGTSCVVGNGACQRVGVYQCNSNGGVSCVDTSGNPVVAGTPSEEICDGRDNNCNGSVDEGFVLEQRCFSGYGACRVEGRTVCSQSGADVTCNATPLTASTEICGDSIDNDCNGLIDDVIGIGASCSAGEGACRSTGVYECISGAVICDAQPLEPLSYEVCGDNIDNNCNGSIDDGFESVGTSCYAGVGICERTGLVICSQDGRSVECSAVPGTSNPAGEICGDNLDNDCDGYIDNDVELNLGATCNVGQGICRRTGQNICSNHSVTCSATAGSADSRGEICANGLDDDCDGSVDENPCLSLNQAPIVQCPTPPTERNSTIDQYGGRAFTLKNYTFTASASDPNGDALTYRWELIDAPDGNGQSPSPTTSLSTIFQPFLISARQVGEPQPYKLRFTATETNTSEHASASCEVKFLAISEDYIHVELIWGNVSDMDLHMVVPTGSDSSFVRTGGDGVDCNYSNCDGGSGMSWSGATTTNQRPFLDIDNTQGFGTGCSGTNCGKPENINVPEPRPNTGDTYRVGVHAYSGTGSSLKIKINCLGQGQVDIVREYEYTQLGGQGWWKPANIVWNTNYCTIP